VQIVISYYHLPLPDDKLLSNTLNAPFPLPKPG
jgi:hypothetical protein